MLYISGLAVFAFLAGSEHEIPGELRTSIWIQSWRTTWLDAVMYSISVPGFWELGIPIVAATLALLFATGRRRESGLMLSAIAFTVGANILLKEIIARPRPPDSVAEVFGSPSSFGFPSGHVMNYVVFLGMLLFIYTGGTRPRLRRTLTHGAFVLALIGVGVSRIYLGVHTFVDVLGGYAFGAVVVLVFASIWLSWVDAGHRREPRPAGK